MGCDTSWSLAFTPITYLGWVHTIDLNADLGEGVTDDLGLLAVVTSANVACGYHAGDEVIMRKVCHEAAARGVVVGAQVSYDDREGFGRRHLDVDFATLVDQVAHQVALLDEIARACGTAVSYVKPHGALYNRVVHDEEQAGAVVEGVLLADAALPVLGLPGSRLLELAAKAGLPAVTEAFADRAYTEEGTLVPRGRDGALLSDPEAVVERSVDLARLGTVTSHSGVRIEVRALSLCLHGDTPGAVELARRVRERLETSGVRVEAFA
jgi:UPF0271 protein